MSRGLEKISKINNQEGCDNLVLESTYKSKNGLLMERQLTSNNTNTGRSMSLRNS